MNPGYSGIRDVNPLDHVCDVLDSGKTKIYEEINEGRLRARKLGKKTIVLGEDLRAYLEALPAARPMKPQLSGDPMPISTRCDRREGTVRPARRRRGSGPDGIPETLPTA
jgi:hypothetical protein